MIAQSYFQVRNHGAFYAHAAGELAMRCRKTLPTHPQGVTLFWTILWWDENGKNYLNIRHDPELGLPVWDF